jgi:hypothetical protein
MLSCVYICSITYEFGRKRDTVSACGVLHERADTSMGAFAQVQLAALRRRRGRRRARVGGEAAPLLRVARRPSGGASVGGKGGQDGDDGGGADQRHRRVRRGSVQRHRCGGGDSDSRGLGLSSAPLSPPHRVLITRAGCPPGGLSLASARSALGLPRSGACCRHLCDLAPTSPCADFDPASVLGWKADMLSALTCKLS